MPIPDWLPKSFDRYDRRARLTPALLVVLPPIFALYVLGASALGTYASAFALLPAMGIWYLVANITRSRGRRVEPMLWAAWGGAPAIQAMRYASGITDAHTLARYHKILGKKALLKMPSEEDEKRDPAGAMSIYESALRWLREHTRDEKRFALLKDENIQYGFRRNGYGVRWHGLIVCGLTLAGVAIHFLVRTDLATITWRTAWASISLGEWLSLALAVLMALVWTTYFTRDQVRDAAFAYANALLSACETI